jgi:hypothetical protein
MSSTSERVRKGFHELPLVLFTALAVSAGGIGAGRLVLAVAGVGGWGSTPAEAASVGGLLALGIAFSILHLGRPSRAGLALLGLGRSALSTEVLAAGATVVAAGVTVLLPQGHPVASVSAGLVPVLSVVVLITVGLVYRLPGQLAWTSLAALTPLVLGLVFGLVLHWGWDTWDGGGLALAALVVFWVLDLLLTVARGIGLEKAGRIGEPSYPEFFRHRRGFLGARFVFVDLLPPIGLLLGWVPLAVPLLGVGLLLDRLAFYGLAVERTTESEVGRVESVLAGALLP